VSDPAARRLAPPHVVLLDALGTLLALEPPASRLRAELARRGVTVTEAAAEAAFRAEIGYYLEHHLEGRDDCSLAALRDRCSEVLRRSLDVPDVDRATALRALLAALRFRAHPDAASALRDLRAHGIRLCVVSNWDCSLPGVLADVGLAPLVDAVVPSATVGAAKPDPRIFEAALDLLHAGPEEAIHVGDSERNDVAGAAAVGVRAVLLNRTGRRRPTAKAHSRSHHARGEDGGADGITPADPPVISTLEALPPLVLEQR
jgi:putative hydrolase of the HAD superfamily